MAVGLVMEVPGGNRDFYDAVCGAMDFPDDWPEGLLAHYAGPGEGVWRVVDAWETREHFDRFANERLMPAVKKTAGDDAPQIAPQFFEIVSEHTAPTRV